MFHGNATPQFTTQHPTPHHHTTHTPFLIALPPFPPFKQQDTNEMEIKR